MVIPQAELETPKVYTSRNVYSLHRKLWAVLIKIEQSINEGGIDWIDLAQDRDRWRAVVNVVMNLNVP